MNWTFFVLVNLSVLRIFNCVECLETAHFINISYNIWIEFEHLFWFWDRANRHFSSSNRLMTNFWFTFCMIFNWNWIELRKTFHKIETRMEWIAIPNGTLIMILSLLFDRTIPVMEQKRRSNRILFDANFEVWSSLIAKPMNGVRTEWMNLQIQMNRKKKNFGSKMKWELRIKAEQNMLKTLLYHYYLQTANASIITHFHCIHGSLIQWFFSSVIWI